MRCQAAMYTTLCVIFYLFNSAHCQTNQTCREDCCGNLPKRPPQKFIFYQNSGRFVGGQGQHRINTLTYAGKGEGYLNPKLQCVKNTGPPPANTYKITFCKNFMHKTKIRPCSFYMQPQDQSKMCGRSQFFVHGCQCCTQGDSSIPPPKGCSQGCIIMNYENRKKLRVGDTLIVKAYEPKEYQQSSYLQQQQQLQQEQNQQVGQYQQQQQQQQQQNQEQQQQQQQQ